jgi:hypothetical protein
VTLSRPGAGITVDGQALSATESAVSEVLVELGLNGALDTATLVLASLSPVADVAPGASIEVALRVGDEETPVLTGTVIDSRRTPWGAVVVAQTEAAVLARARVGRAYVSQTAGDVVSDLISSGGCRPGTVDAPLDLPAYLVSERQSVWRALQDLARLTGSVVRSRADGAVDFAPPRSRPADHSLRAGAEMLSWAVGDAEPAGAVPAVVPSGAGSEAGSSRWQFLLAEPDNGPPGEPTIAPPSVRTRDAAQSVGDRLAASADRRAGVGVVTIVGGHAVRAGDLVDLTDLSAGPDRTWHVLDAQHLLDRWGLRSRLRLEAAA